jgi:hypothetical protein
VRGDESKTEEFKDWKRDTLHDILANIYHPLLEYEANGINMTCPDGQRRLCHPVFATYIADYQEQAFLASITWLTCPKCTIPRYSSKSVGRSERNAYHAAFTSSRAIQQASQRNANDRSERIRVPLPESGRENIDYGPRRGTDALDIRIQLNGDPDALKTHGYKPTKPFTDQHQYSDIYTSIAPDLLHQVCKLFYDDLHDWMLQIISIAYPNVGKNRIQGEIDARFSQLPPYPGLRHFRDGLSTTSRWTGNEYKTMARIYLGIMRDLLPNQAAKLVRAYLDILRLSHYVSHTDTTLTYLENAVKEYISLRIYPESVLVTNDILPLGWWSPKHHLFRHYADWVRSKGALPYCSTDRTEPLHKKHKYDFSRSNKGSHADTFMLRNEERSTAFIFYEGNLDPKDVVHLGKTGAILLPAEPEPEDQSEHESDDDEDSQELPSNLRNMENDKERVSKTISFKGQRWRGERSLENVENEFGLKDFVLETKKTLRWIRHGRVSQGGRVRFEDWEETEFVCIKGYTILSMQYPTVHDSTKAIRELAQSTDQYLYMRDRDWQKPRFDTVLVRFDRSEGDHTMANRKVARLLLLFSVECPQTGIAFELAYVQFFHLVGTGADQHTDMFKVRKDKYAVIEIDAIERGVHLIPCYSGFDTKMASEDSTPSLDVYEDFWVNNYIDEHMYNTIYAGDRW